MLVAQKIMKIILFTSSSGLLESLSAQVDVGNSSANISTRLPASEFCIFNKPIYSFTKKR